MKISVRVVGLAHRIAARIAEARIAAAVRARGEALKRQRREGDIRSPRLPPGAGK